MKLFCVGITFAVASSEPTDSDTTSYGFCKISSPYNACGFCGSEADCGCSGQFPSCCWASRDAQCGSETALEEQHTSVETKPVVVATEDSLAESCLAYGAFCTAPWNCCSGICTQDGTLAFCDAYAGQGDVTTRQEEAVVVKSTDNTHGYGYCKISSPFNACGFCGSEADCGCSGQFPSCCWASRDAQCGSDVELQEQNSLETKFVEDTSVAKDNGYGYCKISSPYNACGFCGSEADCGCSGQFPSCCWASRDAQCGSETALEEQHTSVETKPVVVATEDSLAESCLAYGAFCTAPWNCCSGICTQDGTLAFCDAYAGQGDVTTRQEEAVVVKSTDNTHGYGYCKISSPFNACGFCGSEADCGCSGQFPSCCWASRDAQCGSDVELQERNSLETKFAEEASVAKDDAHGYGYCKISSPYNACGFCGSEADCGCSGQFPSCCWASRDAQCGDETEAGSWVI